VWTDTRSGNAEIETVQIASGPDFLLSPAPASVTTTDSFTSYTISTQALYGFTAPITLSIASAPSAIRTAWGASPVAAGASTQLFVWPGSLPGGDYTIMVRATSGTISHLLPLQLHISDFQLAFDLPSATVVRHPDGSVSPGYVAMDVTDIGGFTSDITLSSVSLPPGFSATFGAPFEFGGGLAISVDATAPRGNATLTFAATGGGRTHAFTVPTQVYDDLIAPTQWSAQAANVDSQGVAMYGGGKIMQPVAIPNDVASAKLSFTLTGVSQADELSVVVRTATGETTVATLQGWWFGGLGSQPVAESVDLARWRGQTIYVELESSAAASGETFYLEDIELRVGP